MKFLAVASTLLLAGSAIAAPGTAIRRERHAKRAAERAAGKSSLIRKVDAPADYETNKTNVDYSQNWAGAVLIGTGYTSVTGTFTVPQPSTTGSGTAWVGIDGDTCASAILQTGVDWTKSGSSYSYDAWYEWYPDYSYDFTGITISAGNQIKVTVTATSKTGGTATVDNISTGKSVTHTFSNEGSEGDLCETNAEWIVEDYEEGNSLVQFADFGSVTFTGAAAVKSGATVGTSGATIIDIQQNNKVLTDCSVPSSSEVTCSYV
ncbi:Aspergillopepsin II heavy chain [Hyphodiscus hymeniophilus]|uniref:Aspergillopepsin II heavy chain n=1 Tax=Hyphodiscus hymeniophilus TaxID=353542 RepID=A0A9P6SMW3_9HELO|nr:Aspergillopepsin II heavy chain [Hyphodiscus hymeniophilus]